MGHQAGISTLNPEKPAGLLTGGGDPGWGMGNADRKPLRKQSLETSRERGLVPRGAAPWRARGLRVQGRCFGLVRGATVT